MEGFGKVEQWPVYVLEVGYTNGGNWRSCIPTYNAVNIFSDLRLNVRKELIAFAVKKT